MCLLICNMRQLFWGPNRITGEGYIHAADQATVRRSNRQQHFVVFVWIAYHMIQHCFALHSVAIYLGGMGGRGYTWNQHALECAFTSPSDSEHERFNAQPSNTWQELPGIARMPLRCWVGAPWDWYTLSTSFCWSSLAG